MPTPIFNADLGFFNTLIEVGVTMRTVYGFTSDNVTYTREPPWKGDGYIAGDDPDGLVTFNGAPAVRTVDLWDRATNTHVASTESAVDGTYSFIGVNMDRVFDVRARGASDTENDLIASRVTPSAQPLSVVFIADQDFHVGDPVSIDLKAVFGFPPYTFSVAGAAWATVSGDVLTLSPPAVTTATITVSATDSHSNTSTRSFDVNVRAAGSYKYWRVFVSTNNSAPNYGSMQELEFRATVGGATLCVGGTPIASSNYPNYFPSLAFDGDTTKATAPEAWAASGSEAQPWLGYELPSPSTVAQIMVCARVVIPLQSPKDFIIQASDDGDSWRDQWTVTGQTGWGAGEIRTFNRP